MIHVQEKNSWHSSMCGKRVFIWTCRPEGWKRSGTELQPTSHEVWKRVWTNALKWFPLHYIATEIFFASKLSSDDLNLPKIDLDLYDDESQCDDNQANLGCPKPLDIKCTQGGNPKGNPRDAGEMEGEAFLSNCLSKQKNCSAKTPSHALQQKKIFPLHYVAAGNNFFSCKLTFADLNLPQSDIDLYDEIKSPPVHWQPWAGFTQLQLCEDWPRLIPFTTSEESEDRPQPVNG